MNNNIFSAIAITVSVFLSGCGPGQSLGPTLTPTLQPTITPTFTPTSTSTPAFTPTPKPTYTPISSDLPLVSTVVRNEMFDDISAFEFEIFGNYDLSNGLIMLDDPVVSGDPWVDGSSGLASNFQIEQRNGYLLLFRSKPDTFFIISFEFGPFDDPSYRAFWVVNGDEYSVWSGTNQIISRSLNFQFNSDTWYYMLMWLNADGVEGKIWEKSDPNTNIFFSADTGSEWASTEFNYSVNVAAGTVEIDEFQELKFSE